MSISMKLGVSQLMTFAFRKRALAAFCSIRNNAQHHVGQTRMSRVSEAFRDAPVQSGYARGT
jgi:hypothetical protein